ncbi:MAG: DUF4392 domain-containing protein [SAR324 cluster bacterium]|nr:DUF4392 domain-containing protein [SAR324 cluster bacterium]
MRPRIASIENLISQDPGGRNIFGLVRRDHLRLAALSLKSARRVLIVSGFFIPAGGAGETDGPPGAKALGDALTTLGISVEYATDRLNRPLFEALGTQPLHGWEPDLLERRQPSHLIAVERVGRSRNGRYYNMRGEDLNANDEPLDEWFLQAERMGIVTIGIGDGGNEIGMGRVFRQVLESIQHGEKIASTVLTDYVIVAGTSNWGAYGLAGALSVVTGRDVLPSAEAAREAVHCVVGAGAVDGISHRNEPTVDSMPLETSISLLEIVRQRVSPSPFRSGTPLDVAVIGLGRTGIAAARLLQRHGHRVRLSDRARVTLPEELSGVPVEMDGHTLEFLESAAVAVTSPGIAARAEIVAQLQGRGVPVISELELACELASPKLIAVTGSEGKLTTVRAISDLLERAGHRVQWGGNKGEPLSALLAAEDSGGTQVVAVSSYQLEAVTHFRPAIAVLLNLRPHRLARHGTMAEYLRIESRIFMNQRGEDILILNEDEPALAPLVDKSWGRTMLLSAWHRVPYGVWMEAGRIFSNLGGEPIELGTASPEHPENLLAAVAVGFAQGLPAETIRAWIGG